jgi:hypothetical protein
MTTQDLMTHLKAGVTHKVSDDVMRSRIATIVRDNPQSGIKRLERGIYGLARSAQNAPPVNQPMAEIDSDDLAGQYQYLLVQNRRKGDAIMGLTRIIASLVADE